MKIKQFILNPFRENTYIVYDDSREAVIIDAGCQNQREQEQISAFVKSNSLQIKHLINTHCHIDHVLGVDALKKLYQVDFMAHADDIPVLNTVAAQACMFGLDTNGIPQIDSTLNEGDYIKFGQTELLVIHTPGHSPGGVCFYSEKNQTLFSGDTLFKGSIGRTDLMGGDNELIINSIHTKLLPLPENVKVFPGHEDHTTIGFEKKYNPFCTS